MSEPLERDAMLCLVTQSCLTLCNPTDCSLPGSSVHRDSPGKNTGVGCHALLQGIFPAQGRFWTLMHCRQILDPLSHQGSPLNRQYCSISQVCCLNKKEFVSQLTYTCKVSKFILCQYNSIKQIKNNLIKILRKPTQHCKAIIVQLKINNFLKKFE